MSLKEYGFPQRPRFIHRTLLLPLIYLGVKGLSLKYLFSGDVHEGYVGDGELRPFCLFMGLLEHIYVLRDACCITVVGENLGGDINNVERMETAVMKLDMIHERLGGDAGVDGIGMPELADPCVLNSVDYEGTTAAFVSFVQLEIMPQIFLNSIEEGADNGSGIVGDGRVDRGMYGRGEHLVVSRFVSSVRGYYPPRGCDIR